jgi:hypothetical protein
VTARAVVLGLAVLVAACGTPSAASPTPTQPSGIRGRVILGSTCPLGGAVDASPCLTPYAAQLIVLDADGERVATVQSAADGSFQVDLAPGDYTILPVTGDPFPAAGPRDVTVVAGQYEELEVNYDTGIR